MNSETSSAGPETTYTKASGAEQISGETKLALDLLDIEDGKVPPMVTLMESWQHQREAYDHIEKKYMGLLGDLKVAVDQGNTADQNHLREMIQAFEANEDFQKYAKQNSIAPAERFSAFLSYIVTTTVQTDKERAGLYSKYLTTIQNSKARDQRINQEEAFIAYPYGISVESLMKQCGFQIWQALNRTILSSANYLGSILGFN